MSEKSMLLGLNTVKIISKLASAFIKKSKKPFCTAVVVAAGSSNRMGGEDKIFAPLGGIPVLAHSLITLENAPCINEIVIVTREDNIVPAADLCAEFSITKATKIVTGGDERVDSVIIGVSEASPKAELIAVHDGARPFVSAKIVSDTVAKAYANKAAAPYIPVNDTIKTIRDGAIVNTLDRSTLAAMQTPQVFNADILKAALHNAKSKGLAVTDDCSAVELLGVTVYLTEGSFENIKITRQTDMVVAESILKAREGK